MVDETDTAIDFFDLPGRRARRWPGIAAGHRRSSARVFRFYALDSSAGTESVGFGLGTPSAIMRTVPPARLFHFGR